MLNYRKANYENEFTVPHETMEFGVDFNTTEQIALCERSLPEHIKALIGDTQVAMTGLPTVGAVTTDTDGIPLLLLNAGFLEFMDKVHKDTETMEHLLVEIITHEMEHVKQIQEGRMVIVDSTKIIWEGVEYPLVQPIGEDATNPEVINTYLDYPWEREAFNESYRALVAIGALVSVEDGWQRARVNLGLTD